MADTGLILAAVDKIIKIIGKKTMKVKRFGWKIGSKEEIWVGASQKLNWELAIWDVRSFMNFMYE